MLNHPLPRTEGGLPGWGPSPQRHFRGDHQPAQQNSRGPRSPHCLTRDQPVPVHPGCPGSQPEPLRRLEERQELNKPRDSGLETSPCFSWAQSLLFIAAWGWGRVLPVPPVTGVFGGDEPVPENPLREQLGSQGGGEWPCRPSPASLSGHSPPPLGSAPPPSSLLPPPSCLPTLLAKAG